MKKLICLILAVAMCVTALPATVLAASDFDGKFFVQYDGADNAAVELAGQGGPTMLNSVDWGNMTAQTAYSFTSGNLMQFMLTTPSSSAGAPYKVERQPLNAQGQPEGDRVDMTSSVTGTQSPYTLEYTPANAGGFMLYVYWTQAAYEYDSFGAKYMAEFEWNGNGSVSVSSTVASNQVTCGSRTKLGWEDVPTNIVFTVTPTGEGDSLQSVWIEQEADGDDGYNALNSQSSAYTAATNTLTYSPFADADGGFVLLRFDFNGSGDPNAVQNNEFLFEYDWSNGAEIIENKAESPKHYYSRWDNDNYTQPETFDDVDSVYSPIEFKLTPPSDNGENVPVVEVEVYDGDGQTPNTVTKLTANTGVYSYTPTKDNGFVIRVWWSQGSYDFDRFNTTDSLPRLVELHWNGSGTVTVDGALDKITNGNNLKVRVAANVDSLPVTLSPATAQDSVEKIRVEQDRTDQNQEGEVDLDNDARFSDNVFTIDLSQAKYDNGNGGRFVNINIDFTGAGGGNDIPVYFPDGVTVSGNAVTFSVGTETPVSVTVTVAGASVVYDEGIHRYGVSVPAGNEQSVSFTVDGNFNAEAMEVAIGASGGFSKVLNLTDGVTHINDFGEGGLPADSGIDFEVRLKNSGPQPPQKPDNGNFLISWQAQQGAETPEDVQYKAGNGELTAAENGKADNAISDADNLTVKVKPCVRESNPGPFYGFNVTVYGATEQDDKNETLVYDANDEQCPVSYADGYYGITVERSADEPVSVEILWDAPVEPDWFTISFGDSANLRTEHGQVLIDRIHIGDNTTYTNIASEVDDIHVFSISGMPTGTTDVNDTDNYDPQLDPYVQCGFAYGSGDIMIKKSSEAKFVFDYRFVPDYGYQVSDVRTNETESLLSDFDPQTAVSTFSYEVENGLNVHFTVLFTSCDDTVSNSSAAVSDVAITGGSNAASSGNIALTVKDTATDSSVNKALDSFELTLENVVSKGGENGSWTTEISEFADPVTVSMTLDKDVYTDDSYSVVRNHNGIKETLEAVSYNSATGELSFETNKFSTYTVVGKVAGSVTPPIAKTTLVYTGKAQALISAGVSNTGTIKYKLSGGEYGDDIPTGTAAKDYEVYYMVVGDATHKDVAEAHFTVTIDQANNKLSAAPASANAVYTGSSQELIKAGQSTFGTIQYKLDDGEYGDEIPEASAIGEYTVYYKVEGTADYKGIAEASITVSIASPAIISGAEQTVFVDADSVAFRSSAPIGEFQRVEVDGSIVDSKYYTVTEGSTIITFSKDFIASLGVGHHTVSIVSTSGTATTGFMMKSHTFRSPNTDNIGTYVLRFSVIFGTLLAMGVITVVTKKKKSVK